MSSWVSIGNISRNWRPSSPRRLTDFEIDDILSALPAPRTNDPFTANIVRDETGKELKKKLRKIKIVPDAIPQLKDRITRKHWQSQAIPGSSVGLTASESIGSTATQTTLNTFHTSGSSKSVSRGNAALSNMIYARVDPPGCLMNIHFRNKHMTPKEILTRYMPIIEACNVSDLLTGHELIILNNYADLYQQFPWLELAKNLQQRIVPSDENRFCLTALQLKVDILKMIKHRITMAKLSSILESEKPVSSVTCVYSTLDQGTILLFPRPPGTVVDFVTELDFYRSSVLPEISKRRVKGLDGVSDFRTITRAVTMLIKEQNLIDENHTYYDRYSQVSGRFWEIILDEELSKETGVGIPDLLNLLELCGVPRGSFSRLDEFSHVIALPSDVTKGPREIINDRVSTEEKKYEDDLNNLALLISSDAAPAQHRANLRRYNNYPYPELLRVAYFNYAEALGDNIKGLYAIKGIDRNRSYSNNIHTINATLGIEAMATYYVKGLYKIITDSGNKVHAANLITTADCIASTGRPRGVRFTGLVARQPYGHLSNATVQKAIDVFTKGAAFGGFESINNASAAVTMGVPVTNGNGMNQVAQFILMEDGKEELFVEDDVYVSHEKNPNTEKLRIEFREARSKRVAAIQEFEEGAEIKPFVLDMATISQTGLLFDIGEGVTVREIRSAGLKFPVELPIEKFRPGTETILLDFLQNHKTRKNNRRARFNYHEFLAVAERPLRYVIPTEQDVKNLIEYLER